MPATASGGAFARSLGARLPPLASPTASVAIHASARWTAGIAIRKAAISGSARLTGRRDVMPFARATSRSQAPSTGKAIAFA